MSISVSGLDLIREYILGVNINMDGKYVEYGYLDGDSFYVNLCGGNFNHNNPEWVHEIAEHCADLLNKDPSDDKEWVCYSEPNYWTKKNEDGESEETDELDEAETIQYMIYQEDKQ